MIKKFFKKISKKPAKQSAQIHNHQERTTAPEREVLQMQKEMNVEAPNLNEELADVLIAISVVAKRLAKKLQEQSKDVGGQDNENQ